MRPEGNAQESLGAAEEMSGLSLSAEASVATVTPISCVAKEQPSELPKLEFTGERIVPGQVGENLFREHEVRYQFAGKFVQGKDVVDVACGTGIGTDYLRRVAATSCLGLDIDRGAIEYAQAAYRRCGFAQCDATQMPLADNSIDVVVSFETIEHLRDPSTFLRECNRVLRPGGILICSTPNRRVYRWHGPNPFHVHEFLPTEFLAFLSSVFPRVKVYSQENRLYPLFVLKSLASRLTDKVGLKGYLQKLLRRLMSQTSTLADFGTDPNGALLRLQPFSPKWILQPTYVIAVAQKFDSVFNDRAG